MPYYYESETGDGELVTFEAGHIRSPEEYDYVESRPLALCEFPVRAPYSRRALDCERPCEMTAIARVIWANGDEWKLCRKHHAKIRDDFKMSNQAEE